MPIVHIHMYEGRTVDQKRELVKRVTEAIVESVDAKPESVHIVIHDMARHDYGDGGKLGCDA
ncbi:MAG: 4-oxalocrotonate tautomerase [Coriobacteriia bacterium]|nr:4-oxalocrotonate tautomerase [Coriobacteriia bacterium]